MTKIACLGAEILLSMYLTLSTQPAFADLLAEPASAEAAKIRQASTLGGENTLCRQVLCA